MLFIKAGRFACSVSCFICLRKLPCSSEGRENKELQNNVLRKLKGSEEMEELRKKKLNYGTRGFVIYTIQNILLLAIILVSVI